MPLILLVFCRPHGIKWNKSASAVILKNASREVNENASLSARSHQVVINLLDIISRNADMFVSCLCGLAVASRANTLRAPRADEELCNRLGNGELLYLISLLITWTHKTPFISRIVMLKSSPGSQQGEHKVQTQVCSMFRFSSVSSFFFLSCLSLTIIESGNVHIFSLQVLQWQLQRDSLTLSHAATYCCS